MKFVTDEKYFDFGLLIKVRCTLQNGIQFWEQSVKATLSIKGFLQQEMNRMTRMTRKEFRCQTMKRHGQKSE